MNKQKAAAIAVIIGLSLVVIGSVIYVIVASNVTPLTPTSDEESSSVLDNTDTDELSSPTPTPPNDTPQNSSAIGPITNAGLSEASQSDPITKYLSNAFITPYYSISLSVDKNMQLIVVIVINMPTPQNNNARRNADQHYQNALQQIRDWGFNPNDYTIRIAYND